MFILSICSTSPLKYVGEQYVRLLHLQRNYVHLGMELALAVVLLALAVVLTADALLVDLDHHRKLLVSSFSPLHTPATSSSSVATLVKRLQER